MDKKGKIIPLAEIKEQVAKQLKYTCWQQLLDNMPFSQILMVCDTVSKMYAVSYGAVAAVKSLEKGSNEASIKGDNGDLSGWVCDEYGVHHVIDKKSILNSNNVILPEHE